MKFLLFIFSISLLLVSCGGSDPLGRICSAACQNPITVFPDTSVDDIAVISYGFTHNGNDCGDYASFMVGSEETELLSIGESDLGVTLVNVHLGRVEVCLNN